MTTAQKKKYLYQRLLPIVEAFGFVPYKGRLWCYRPEMGLLFYIESTPTSWGTLNDVEVGFCTYCAPVREGFLKQERRVGSYVGLCRYIRIQKGFSVYALYGTSADEIFMEQVEKILPYLHEELRRMFDVKYRTDVAAHMALFMDMQAEMKDLILPDFALYQYWKGHQEQALAFLERRVQSLRQIVEELTFAEKRLVYKTHYDRLCQFYQDQIDEAMACARRMEERDPQLSEEIRQRVGQSVAVCQGSFKRFKGC